MNLNVKVKKSALNKRQKKQLAQNFVNGKFASFDFFFVYVCASFYASPLHFLSKLIEPITCTVPEPIFRFFHTQKHTSICQWRHSSDDCVLSSFFLFGIHPLFFSAPLVCVCVCVVIWKFCINNNKWAYNIKNSFHSNDITYKHVRLRKCWCASFGT